MHLKQAVRFKRRNLFAEAERELTHARELAGQARVNRRWLYYAVEITASAVAAGQHRFDRDLYRPVRHGLGDYDQLYRDREHE